VFFASRGELSSMRRHFLINLLIGLAIFVLLRAPFVQQNAAVAAARDAVITWQMDRLTGLDAAPRLAWIDVDDAAHHAWGVASETRRDKIAQLIAFAVGGRPVAIVVDFDLTDPMLGLERDDDALKRYLATYANSCSSCPPLLLVRTMGHSAYWYAGRGPALQARRSFLDPALGTLAQRPWTPGRVMWGTVAMDRDPDMIERRWRLWESSCSAPGPAVVLPSLTLLAAAIATSTPLASVRDALTPHALTCVPGAQAAEAGAAPTQVTTLRLGKATLTLAEDDISRRVSYRIPWKPNDPNATAPAVTLPAGEITKNPQAVSTILAGRVVVIGASFTASRDIHMTPIGPMPGALVLINAIDSLLSGHNLNEPNWLLTLVIEFVLILIVSAFFAYLRPGWALTASLATILVGTLTVGFVAFNSGIWIDSVVPLLAVTAHEFIDRVHHHVSRLIKAR
jgi:CHASE2 domain-containing sensor protein